MVMRLEWKEEIRQKVDRLSTMREALLFIEKESKFELDLETAAANRGDLEDFFLHHNRYRTLTQMWRVALDIAAGKA